MLEKLAEAIVSFFIKHGGALEEDRDIYEYGIVIALSTLINLIITISIGLMLKIPQQLLFYIVPFILLRGSAGGYHAKTFWGCVIASSFLIVVVVMLILYAPSKYYLLLSVCFNVFSMAVVVSFAPVSSKERKLSREYEAKLKKRSIILVILCLAIQVMLYLFGSSIYMFCIALGLLATSCTLVPNIVEILKNSKRGF